MENENSNYLIPPYGKNLLNLLGRNLQMQKEVSDLIQESGWMVIFDNEHQLLKVAQVDNPNHFLLPFSSIS
jgi:LEA14-like dessication related protein